MVPNLGEKCVQVWRVRLRAEDASLQERHGLLRQSYSVLTGAERQRAARIRPASAREEFIVGRGCLRRLLGAILEMDPRAVALETGEHGKLQLRSGGVEFNVAHSQGVVLIALAGAGDVGVDVEFLDAGVEWMDVARAAFHSGDLARIERAITPDERLREFYLCWTRREAVTKADGRGLNIAPDEFSAAADAVELTPAPAVKQRYFVRGLDVGRAHVAAVATSAEGMELGCFELSPRSPLLFAE
jgi:4'-phosphopantetheinyl transferase